MKNANAAPRRRRGFTLIEMLIVVAIIAVLVAVSIPLVQNSLERTREATDMANERAARAAATLYFMEEKPLPGSDGEAIGIYYDAQKGELVYDIYFEPKPYGKCSRHKNGYLCIGIDENTGEVIMLWMGGEIEEAEDMNPHLYPPITWD